LMTSVSTVMGAVPVALGLGAGSSSRRPLGYSIVGGVLLSTLLTLFLVPVVYVLFDSLRQRVRGRRPALATSKPAVAEAGGGDWGLPCWGLACSVRRQRAGLGSRFRRSRSRRRSNELFASIPTTCGPWVRSTMRSGGVARRGSHSSSRRSPP